MKVLGLITLGSLVLSGATPVWAQTSSPSMETAPEQAQLEAAEELPPDLAAPLEVDQRQADEFFTPQRPQPIQRETGPALSSDELIGPPPGTQTADELTPGQQLTIPIR